MILLLAVPTLAQDALVTWQSMEPAVNDARASSMGHCEMFGSLDGSAIFSNPAWMGATHDLSIEFGGATRWGSVDDEELTRVKGDVYSFDYKGGFEPMYAAAALPIRIPNVPLHLGAGVGIWTMHDSGWDSEVVDYDPDYGEFTEKNEFKGLFQVAGIGLSAGLFDMLYAGITAGSSTGEMLEVSREFEYESGDVYSQRLEATPSFSIAIASLVVKPNNIFKIGVFTRPAYDVELTDVMQENQYFGTTVELPNQTLTYPATQGISVALTPTELIEFIFEYQSRNYSELELSYEDGSTLESPFEDGHAIRFGAQFGALQFGYFNESIAMAEYGADEEPLAIENRQGFTFGFGYRGERLSLHIFGEYGALEYEDDPIGFGFDSESREISETIWRVGGGIGIHLF
jgi:hypothetical protein